METARHNSSFPEDQDMIAESHRMLLATLAQLAQASDQEFIKGYPALVAAIERDFRDEENQMEDADGQLFQAHMEQHARMLGALHHVMPRVQDGDVDMGREAVALLVEWMPFHIATSDAVLARAVQARLLSALRDT